MKTTRIAAVALAMFMVAAGLVVYKSPQVGKSGLGALNETVTDVDRDADQLSMRSTRVTEREEIAEGDRIARQLPRGHCLTRSKWSRTAW